MTDARLGETDDKCRAGRDTGCTQPAAVRRLALPAKKKVNKEERKRFSKA